MIKYVKPINLTNIIPQAPESILCAKLCSSDILSKNTHVACLRGSLPKSGPLDFATKNAFPLFFVGEEALVGVY